MGPEHSHTGDSLGEGFETPVQVPGVMHVSPGLTNIWSDLLGLVAF